jgi:hypothetical protein
MHMPIVRLLLGTASLPLPSTGTLLLLTVGATSAVALRALSARVNERPFKGTLLLAVGAVAAMSLLWKTWLVGLVVASFLVTVHPVIGREPGPIVFATEMIGGALALLASTELLRRAVGIG